MSLLRLYRNPRAMSLGLGLSAFAATGTLVNYQLHSRPLLCESALSSPSGIFQIHQRDAASDVTKPNPALLRQLSSGSILGLVSGVAVSMFSRTLTFLIGAGIAGIQFLEHKGIHIVPTQTIQRWFKSWDVKSALRENVAFKLCFGLTFALSAFAQF